MVSAVLFITFFVLLVLNVADRRLSGTFFRGGDPVFRYFFNDCSDEYLLRHQ